MVQLKDKYSGNNSQSGRNIAKKEGVSKGLSFGQY